MQVRDLRVETPCLLDRLVHAPVSVLLVGPPASNKLFSDAMAALIV